MEVENKLEVGARVGAVCDLQGKIIELFGYGIYQGDEACPLMHGAKNPKILLDSGEIVWGCECWWGREDKIKACVEKKRMEQPGLIVRVLDIKQIRADFDKKRDEAMLIALDEFGEVAYSAYCENRGWKSFDGKDLPKWQDVRADIKDGWRAAMRAVIEMGEKSAVEKGLV